MKNHKSSEKQTGRSPVFSTLISLTNLVLFVGVIAFLLFRNEKIVYVDSMKLLSGYEGMAVAKKEFESKVAVWNANIDTLKLEMDQKFKEYEAKAASLSTKEKMLMEELLETKRQQYLNYQQMISEKIKKEDQELTQKVYTRVDAYLKQYGEENGYEFILGANQYGNIVYARNAVDVTDDVLKGLNLEFKN